MTSFLPSRRRRRSNNTHTAINNNVLFPSNSNDQSYTRRLEKLYTRRKSRLKWSKSVFFNRIWTQNRKIAITLLVVLSIAVFYIIIIITIGKSNSDSIVSIVSKEDPLIRDISINELYLAKEQLIKAKTHLLAPLRPIDKSKFTVRINTWRRNEQLIASVKHFSTCPGVHQIQIVWCDQENQPPLEILKLTNSTEQEHPKVEVEYHSVNSLNERFHVLSKTETLGILSVDDDVLRPCEAVDDGFFRWTDNPERMVGFDYRMHVVNDQGKGNNNLANNKLRKNANITRTNKDEWTYGYLSDTRKENLYSMVLPRFCFIHVDYLNLYMKYMPKRILDVIDKSFNCEDIGMSFFVSSLTESKVPLLANQWSISTMVKFASPSAISDSSNHKEIRDKCIDKFGHLLGLKDAYEQLFDDHRLKLKRLENQQIWHNKKQNTLFGIGVDIDEHPLHIDASYVPRRKAFIQTVRQWGKGGESFLDLHSSLQKKVKDLGLFSN